MRALVTGFAGFLGQHLTAALLDRGTAVVGLLRDRVGQSTVVPNVIVHGELVDASLLQRALAEYSIDTVFHLAAQTQVSTAEADPSGTFEANVRGTWIVLEACRRYGVKRIVHMSSDKVYGDAPAPYHEDQPVLASSGIYATSKACADLLAQSYMGRGMGVAVVRCGNMYGPGFLNWSTLIADAIRCSLTGQRLIIRSDGASRRDYVFVQDAVAALLTIADAKHEGTFNVGTGTPTSVLEVVARVEGATGKRIDVEVQATASREIKDQWLTVGRAAALGWQPRFSLETGLAATVPWYRANLGVQ